MSTTELLKPLELDLTAQPSLCAVFQQTAETAGERIAVRTLDRGTQVTWREYQERVERVARGLAALGVGHGDTVGLLMASRPEFHLADTAALHLGATCVSVYPTLPAEDVAWTLRDATAKILFTETALLEVALEAHKHHAFEIVLIDGEYPDVLSLDALIARGSPDFDFEASWRAVSQDDLALIVYTSGTTGTPKGVELSHGAILGNAQGLHNAIGTLEGARVISYLPMAHMAERQLSHYRAMAGGFEVITCPNPSEIATYLARVKPHYFFGPPRMLDKFRPAAMNLLERPDATPASVLDQLGLGQVRVALTGSAPVPHDLSQFWIDLGLPLVEAWGITECGAFGAFGRPGDYKIGTCGKALPGVEIRLADDGEILLRSPWLMRGYRGRPDLTGEAIDPEGWLHTGDVGSFDQEGNLSIIDRKKEIIINAAGKNMSPAHIESRIKDSSPLIGEACVIGNDRPYNVALIQPDPDELARRGELPREEIERLLADALAHANQRLARVEQIKRFKLLSTPWIPGGDELTPTMKLRRRVIAEKYQDEIESLYADGGLEPTSAENTREYAEWPDNDAPYGQDENAWRRWAENMPICKAYGVTCTTIGPGNAVLVLDTSPIPLNPNGSIFGGITAAIADAALGAAFMPSVEPGQLPATAHLAVEYHRPALLPLTFNARVTNQGRTLLFADVNVTGPDGRTCSLCHGVMAIKPKITPSTTKH